MFAPIIDHIKVIPIEYSTDVETAWARLKDLLFHVMATYIPKKRHHSQLRPQWFTSEIQNHLNKLHTLRKKVKRNPTEHNKRNLKAAENVLQQLILSARQTYESALIDHFSKSNSNNIYKFMSSLTSSRSIPTTMFLDSNTLNDDSSISNGFNNQFLPRVQLTNHQPLIVQLTYHPFIQSASSLRKFIIVFHPWMLVRQQKLMA